MIESGVQSAESVEARSTESLCDVAQVDALNLRQGFYIYIYICLDVCMVLDLVN